MKHEQVCCHSDQTDGTVCPGNSSAGKDLGAHGQLADCEKEMLSFCKESQQPPGPGISILSCPAPDMLTVVLG